jgi:putative methionine-R-sulfoxide reductase with GAF domain
MQLPLAMPLSVPPKIRLGGRRTARARPRLAGGSRVPAPRDARCRALQTIGALIIAGARGENVVLQIAELIQRTCHYRWLGVYKIIRHEFVLIAATNHMRPAYPRFPITQGLSAEAIEKRATLIVRDVSKEPKFLPNFWTTKSEIIVPIIDDEHNRVAGTIVAESSKLNAFKKSDRDFLEGAARLIWRALV